MQPNLAPETWPPGKVIAGRWIIEQRLAAGSFGAVYRAPHQTLLSKCAIKRLREESNYNEAVVAAFTNEAKSMAALSRCRYVVQVYDIDVSDDRFHYIRMELVEGGSLQDELDSLPERRMEVSTALTITKHVLSALDAAHSENIKHLDVKTRNIMLQKDRNEITAKLTDFGIAAHIAETRSIDLRGFGTPGFSPLEQISGTRRRSELDGRTDLYALGMTLYRMLTGRAPFEYDDDGLMWLNLIRGAPVPRPSEYRPELKEWTGLDDFVLKLTHRVPEGRFSTAAEALAVLSTIEHNKKSGASIPTTQRNFKVSTNGPVFAMFCILLVVLVLIVVLVSVSGPTPQH